MKTVLIFLLAAPLAAAPPVLTELSPRGAQRGKSFTLYIRGDGLTQGARVESTLPASFSQLTLSKDPLGETAMAKPGTVLPFLVALKSDALVGFYPVRVSTPDGISNVFLFSVSDLPEVEEIESKNPKQSNDDPSAAQKIAVPAVVNGTLAGPDVDNFAFTAKAGQKMVFEVEARRAGSAIDPAIEIFDSAGRELARNDDARSLLRDLFRSEADLLPDLERGLLRVEVHPMSNPRSNRAISFVAARSRIFFPRSSLR